MTDARAGAPRIFHVLVVDDDPAMRLMVRAMLERDRRLHVVAEAFNGKDAVTLVERTCPDAVVLGDIALTRARTGVLVKQDTVHYMADTSASEGDSGAPFIDARTGQAVGIVRDFGLTDNPPVTDDGPTLQRILTLLTKAGFRLHLVTAPLIRS